MQNNIPVPTDNIFKFYALFGLLLFVFSCGSLLYVNNATNSLVISLFPEFIGLKQIEKPSRADSAKIELIERRLEVTKSDKDFYLKAISVLAALGVITMSYGFFKWHVELQPVLDETAKVQLEIAKLQFAQLRRELATKDEPQSPSVRVGTKHTIVWKSRLRRR